MIKKNKSVYLIYALLAIPLCMDLGGGDIFEVPKVIALKWIMTGLMVHLLVKWIQEKKITIQYSPVILIFSVFALISMTIATVFSPYSIVAFWGSFYRQSGMLISMHFLLLYWSLVQIKIGKKQIQTVCMAIAAIGGIIGAIGIAQKAGWNWFSHEITAILSGRPYSTLGNPTALGAYLIFPIFASFYLIFNQKKSRFLWIIALLTVLIALLLTLNRATWLGIIAIVPLTLLHRNGYKKGFIAYGIGLLGSITGGYLYFNPGIRSLLSRQEIWKTTLKIWVENPLQIINGFGSETYQFWFEKWVKKDYFLYEDYTTLIDRVHNQPMQWLFDFGLGGLLLYLFIIWIVIKAWKRKDSDWELWMSGALIALGISNLFGFHSSTHSIYAIIALWIITLKFKTRQIIIPLKWILLPILTSVFLLVSGSVLFTQNRALKNAVILTSKGDYEEAVQQAWKFKKWNPYDDTYPILIENFLNSPIAGAMEPQLRLWNGIF
ncbi:O-antigen ligase family protein [Candidatus Peregrinibacteria bacterium]|nr:MAG: O-antigen ligase family protein [Candidatus Peregrinibacteria bacterium]